MKITNLTSNWCRSVIDEVKQNILSIPYNNKIYFVKGMVENTLPNNKHNKIALLRLDTDWYSSTKMELELLFPKLTKGGVLILDDYGHWSGAKKAVDEYIENNNLNLVLQIDDSTGRTVIK